MGKKLIALALLVLSTNFAFCDREPVDKVNAFSGTISHLLVPTQPDVYLPNAPMKFRTVKTGGSSDFTIAQINLFMLNMGGTVPFGIMPFNGEFTSPITAYLYDNEDVSPYYYSVYLNEPEIRLDVTVAKKSAIMNLEFRAEASSGFALFANAGECEIQGNEIKLKSAQHFNGGFRNPLPETFDVHTYATLSEVPIKSEIKMIDKRAYLILTFDKSVRNVEMKYSLSYISAEQANINFEKEIANKSFARVKKEARSVWNKTLSQITVKGGTKEHQKMLYTSLYRSYARMTNVSEDGQYLGYDQKIHKDDSFDYYIDDAIWDSYICQNPLALLLNPKMQVDKIKSYIKMYEQSGSMPTFPMLDGDAHVMNGNHYATLFIDAHARGLTGFDLQKAFEGCKKTILERSMIPWYRGANTVLDDFYHKNGFFPALNEGEEETVEQVEAYERRQSVAVTLAQSYDDWCVAKMAKALGYKEDYDFFIKRAFNYHNLFNKENTFFHPKNSEGNFITPFDPITSRGPGARDFYDENNAWTYNWDVRHNIADLISLFGSKDAFEKKLDAMFVEPLGMTKYQWTSFMPDSSGMVGQFSMGNEPSFHIPYLYCYIGSAWKTQKLVRFLCDRWLRSDFMGIPGDEDGGAMSSFYVFSSMGFYPVTPGLPMYVIGTPFFEEVKIRLDNGKKFVIKARNYSPMNKYIQSAKLNGKDHNRAWFTHQELINGGVLEFEMGLYPNKSWGADNLPPSFDM